MNPEASEIIDGETGELIPYTPAPPTLFGTSNPKDVIAKASESAVALADVIRSQHLYKTIGGKNHVFVEAWTLLGSMLGVFPVVVWTKPLENGWEARVEARTLAGELVGAAEAECRRDEPTWAKRADYALRSMAQTRATSRALRGPLGFIVVLAGYSATAAEEIADAPQGPNRSATGADTKEPTKAQWGKLGATIKEMDENPDLRPPDDVPTWEEYSKHYAKQMWGVDSRSDLTRGQVAHLITHLLEGAPPF